MNGSRTRPSHPAYRVYFTVADKKSEGGRSRHHDPQLKSPPHSGTTLRQSGASGTTLGQSGAAAGSSSSQSGAVASSVAAAASAVVSDLRMHHHHHHLQQEQQQRHQPPPQQLEQGCVKKEPVDSGHAYSSSCPPILSGPHLHPSALEQQQLQHQHHHLHHQQHQQVSLHHQLQHHHHKFDFYRSADLVQDEESVRAHGYNTEYAHSELMAGRLGGPARQ